MSTKSNKDSERVVSCAALQLLVTIACNETILTETNLTMNRGDDHPWNPLIGNESFENNDT